MGQKNKLCSSNKVDVDNIVLSALQYGLRTLEDNLFGPEPDRKY